MALRVLYIAEIVGKAGVYAVKRVLPRLRRERSIDFVIAGGDGVTGGAGLGKNHAVYLRKLGVDVLTLGECAYYKKDIVEHLEKTSAVLRPANAPQGTPGRGWKTYESSGGRLGVAVLLGQAGFSRTHLANPFHAFQEISERIRRDSPFSIFDFHATTTAEKQTLFSLARGRATAVIGSHTRVATADEGIIDGTAVITDAGRTGSIDSVGGRDSATRISEYLSGIPDWSRDAWGRVEFQALIIEAGPDGRAQSVERVHIPVEVPDEAKGDSGGEGSGEDSTGS